MVQKNIKSHSLFDTLSDCQLFSSLGKCRKSEGPLPNLWRSRVGIYHPSLSTFEIFSCDMFLSVFVSSIGSVSSVRVYPVVMCIMSVRV
jgi:hypothetical protein